MKKTILISALLTVILMLSACAGGLSSEMANGSEERSEYAEVESGPENIDSSEETSEAETTSDDQEELKEAKAKEAVNNMNTDSATVSGETGSTRLQMTIGDEQVAVFWEDNESVDALIELVQDGPLTIQMSMYGGFEQVGALGTSLPRDDEQTTTSAGDIVLYSGNQIVVFYGSNSWAYTRLGKITDKEADEMAELLGNGNVEITIEMEELRLR